MWHYSICKQCGTLHDDGTAELCVNCLDKIYAAPKKENKNTKIKKNKGKGGL